MLFIGITGGVGAGKSAILKYLSEKYNCRVMLADEIAHDVMEPGTECYKKLRQMFAKDDVFFENGQIDRPKMAQVLFSDDSKREELNAIVHPAVREYVDAQTALERERNQLDFLILEAALLIEEHYDAICDELWYIYTSEENRRIRLKENRGYSDEKIDNIFQSQLSDEEFRAYCTEVIDNNASKEEVYRQAAEILDKRGIKPIN